MKLLITLESMKSTGRADWRKPFGDYQHAVINNVLESAARIVGVELDIASTDLTVDQNPMNTTERTVRVNYLYKGRDLCTVEFLEIDDNEFTVSRKPILEEAIRDCCIFLMDKRVKFEANVINQLT